MTIERVVLVDYRNELIYVNSDQNCPLFTQATGSHHRVEPNDFSNRHMAGKCPRAAVKCPKCGQNIPHEKASPFNGLCESCAESLQVDTSP